MSSQLPTQRVSAHPETLSAKFLDGSPSLMVGTVFCIGRNYPAHAQELSNPLPREPVVFLKPISALLESGGVIRLPAASTDVQHEVEIVVLLGEGGRHLSPEQARRSIAGYGIGIDITARDLQRQAQESGTPWTIAKGFDTFAPFSRFAPASTISGPMSLEFELRVNGIRRQSGNARDMIFTYTEIITYLSSVFTLRPGDLVFTGTPSGVAQIRPGDALRACLLGTDVLLSVKAEQE